MRRDCGHDNEMEGNKVIMSSHCHNYQFNPPNYNVASILNGSKCGSVNFTFSIEMVSVLDSEIP